MTSVDMILLLFTVKYSVTVIGLFSLQLHVDGNVEPSKKNLPYVIIFGNRNRVGS
ncbi:hypothetical protein D3C74_25560 [compost metagenome]